MEFISNFFGEIFNIIFNVVDVVTPIGTLGIAIILFTFFTRLLLTPLQIKQQRTTRGMSKIQPELQKIQQKYAGKKDQQSQMAQSQEMQALYKKYNINPLAGCLPLLIQLPLIYALYAVLRAPSKHITKLYELYQQLALAIETTINNSSVVIAEVLKQIPLSATAKIEIDKLEGAATLGDTISNFTTQHWNVLMEKIPSLNGPIAELLNQKIDYEYFIFNLVDSPSQIVASGNYFAFLIPILAGASTFIFSKISMAQSQPSTKSADGQPSQTESMMKTMNIIMPIMMGAISYTVPYGLALYWIAGNLIMMGQQVFVAKIVKREEAELEARLEAERAEAKRLAEAKRASSSKRKKGNNKPNQNQNNNTNNNNSKPKKNENTEKINTIDEKATDVENIGNNKPKNKSTTQQNKNQRKQPGRK